MTAEKEQNGTTVLNEDALERTTGGAPGRPGGAQFSFADGSVRATGGGESSGDPGMDLASLNIQRAR